MALIAVKDDTSSMIDSVRRPTRVPKRGYFTSGSSTSDSGSESLIIFGYGFGSSTTSGSARIEGSESMSTFVVTASIIF